MIISFLVSELCDETSRDVFGLHELQLFLCCSYEWICRATALKILTPVRVVSVFSNTIIFTATSSSIPSTCFLQRFLYEMHICFEAIHVRKCTYSGVASKVFWNCASQDHSYFVHLLSSVFCYSCLRLIESSWKRLFSADRIISMLLWCERWYVRMLSYSAVSNIRNEQSTLWRGQEDVTLECKGPF